MGYFGKIGIFLVFFLSVRAWAADAVAQPQSHFEKFQPEMILPDSPYKDVYQSCIDVWRQVRSSTVHQGRAIGENGLQRTNEAIIEKLVLLYAQVFHFLKNDKTHSLEDLEYLMGLLHQLHVDYATLARHRGMHDDHEQTVCTLVLFKRLQDKIEQILQQS